MDQGDIYLYSHLTVERNPIPGTSKLTLHKLLICDQTLLLELTEVTIGIEEETRMLDCFIFFLRLKFF